MASNKTMRDLIASVYLSGSTSSLNAQTATATDMLASVVSSGANPALNISLGGGSGTATFAGDVEIAGNLTVSGSTFEQDQYVVNDLYVRTISDNIGTGVTFNDSILISTGNNLYLDQAQYQYFGDENTDGSWRFYISGVDMIFQRRIAGTWTTKGTFTGS